MECGWEIGRHMYGFLLYLLKFLVSLDTAYKVVFSLFDKLWVIIFKNTICIPLQFTTSFSFKKVIGQNPL